LPRSYSSRSSAVLTTLLLLGHCWTWFTCRCCTRRTTCAPPLTQVAMRTVYGPHTTHILVHAFSLFAVTTAPHWVYHALLYTYLFADVFACITCHLHHCRFAARAHWFMVHYAAFSPSIFSHTCHTGHARVYTMVLHTWLHQFVRTGLPCTALHGWTPYLHAFPHHGSRCTPRLARRSGHYRFHRFTCVSRHTALPCRFPRHHARAHCAPPTPRRFTTPHHWFAFHYCRDATGFTRLHFLYTVPSSVPSTPDARTHTTHTAPHHHIAIPLPFAVLPSCSPVFAFTTLRCTTTGCGRLHRIRRV